MRLLLFIIPVMLIAACNNSSDKKADTKDTAKQEIQVTQHPAGTDTLFYGFGGNPFWAVYVINNNKIFFVSGGELPDVEVPYVASTTTDSNTTNYSSISGKDTINLTIVKKDCTTMMSKEIHPYQVTLKVNKGKYTGCGIMGVKGSVSDL